jgi:PAS domain S-box-containing protein
MTSRTNQVALGATDSASPPRRANAKSPGSRATFLHRLRGALPTGRSLPDEAWSRRHRALLGLLWLHAPAIALFALYRGFGLRHSLLEGSVVIAIASLATFATQQGTSRKLCSGLVSFGLLTSSAIVVHISGGYIEAHFHFFVMLSILLLYEDWFPFLLAFAYVVLHHGVAGTLDPESVYNHPGAQAHPWKWATIHGLFISAAGAANIIAWRLNEEVRARSRNAYRQARESEERFRSAFENAPIGVGLQALSGRWLQVNRALCDILGHPREQLLALDSRRITHPDDLASHVEQARQLEAGEIRAYQTEKRFVHAGGHVIWCHLSVSLVRDDAGEPLHLITQVEDITERKRAEQYLEAQRAVASVLAGGGDETEVFPKLLEALGEAMNWELGMVWTRGKDPDALVFQDAWHAWGEVADFVAESKRFAFPPGEGLPGRVWASGDPTWINDVTRDSNFPRAEAAKRAGLHGAIGLPIFSGDEVVGVIEFFGQELRQPDRDLTRTLRTVSRQVSQFIERRRAEQEADRLKDEFVALVSHELRTPLTSIMGYLDLMLEGEGGPLTDEQKHFLSIVGRNSTRLLRLVGDLLFIAQAEQGELLLELGTVELDSLLQDCVEGLGRAAADKEITLTVLTEPTPPLHGDRARLAQLLDNLVSNAIKFTPSSGSVTVRKFRSGEGVVLEVSDSGIGIPAAEQEALFRRFFRASTATQRAIPGTGLGLAITKAIADAHGARITVESTEGAGTTFRVELPLEGVRAQRGDVISGSPQIAAS